MSKDVKCEKCINRKECKYRLDLFYLRKNVNLIVRTSVFRIICIRYKEVKDNTN